MVQGLCFAIQSMLIVPYYHRLKSTQSLSRANIINLGCASFSVIGLSIRAPQLGAAIGAIGLIIGYTAEMIYVRYTYYRLTKDAPKID
ncbi:MAG: hypothetical protein H0S78_05280 [Tissierellales bacterium]|nr:hypothetical protein [Tissierellales bacterium]